MSGVILEQRTGVSQQHVPYRGAPTAVLAVVNGEVQGILQRADGAGSDQGRQAQGARRHHPGALGDAARRADDDRSRRAGLRGRHVAGICAAGRHAGPIVARLNAEPTVSANSRR